MECFHPSFIPATQRLEVAMHTECIARFNDHQMMVDRVLAAFDRAIEAGDPTIARIRRISQESSMGPIVKGGRAGDRGQRNDDLWQPL